MSQSSTLPLVFCDWKINQDETDKDDASWTSMANDWIDWFNDVLGLSRSNRHQMEDFLFFGLLPVTASSPGDLVLSAIDFHPFSWLALGIMLFSSQLIASRAKRYKQEGQELAGDASRVLLISGAVQAAVCGLDYADLMQPLAESLSLSSPFLVARFLQDALILPFWVTCIGRGMRQPQEARLAYSYAGVGNVFQIAAVWCDAWDVSKCMLIPAAMCMGIASSRVLRYDATGVPLRSRADMQTSSYLLVFYMFSGFITEVLGVSHEIGEEQMLVEYAVLDLVGKIPSCHLFTRSLAGSDLGREDVHRLEIHVAEIEEEVEDELVV